MPLLLMQCKCGYAYEAIQSFSTIDPDLERCPKCGGAPARLAAAGILHRAPDLNGLSALEMEEHLEARRFYESRSADILSGKISLRERGPKELRPVCPERLRKKYF